MAEYVWQDAWILLALRGAQAEGDGATREQLDRAGDAICHAMILNSELEHAIEVLSPCDLIRAEGGAYRLGPAFQDFWVRSGADRVRTGQKQLELLQRALDAQS